MYPPIVGWSSVEPQARGRTGLGRIVAHLPSPEDRAAVVAASQGRAEVRFCCTPRQIVAAAAATHPALSATAVLDADAGGGEIRQVVGSLALASRPILLRTTLPCPRIRKIVACDECACDLRISVRGVDDLTEAVRGIVAGEAATPSAWLTIMGAVAPHVADDFALGIVAAAASLAGRSAGVTRGGGTHTWSSGTGAALPCGAKNRGGPAPERWRAASQAAHDVDGHGARSVAGGAVRLGS